MVSTTAESLAALRGCDLHTRHQMGRRCKGAPCTLIRATSGMDRSRSPMVEAERTQTSPKLAGSEDRVFLLSGLGWGVASFEGSRASLYAKGGARSQRANLLETARGGV